MKNISKLFLLIIAIFTTLNSSMAYFITTSTMVSRFDTKSYEISIDSNGGVFGNTSVVISNNLISLPTLTRTGYNLKGYSNSQDGELLYSKDSIVIDDINNKQIYAIWGINSYTVDVNPIINGTTYNSGLSGYTFDVWVNDVLVADNVIDWCTIQTYGTKVRIVANSVNGYNIISGGDQTIIVGTSNVYLNPNWLDNIGPTITGYSLTNLSYHGYNSQYNFHTYNYHINASATDVSGVSKICYSLWSNNSNRWLDDVCHSGGNNTEDYTNVIQGNRVTRITFYDGRGNITVFNYNYYIP